MGQAGGSECFQKWILLLKPESCVKSFPQLPGTLGEGGDSQEEKPLHGAILYPHHISDDRAPRQTPPIAVAAGLEA